MDALARALALKFIKGKADLVNGKIPAGQLPSYVDDAVEYDSFSDFPAEGEEGKIYVAKDTGYTYRWTGSGYVQIGGQDLSDYATLNTEQTFSAKKIFKWNVPVEFWQDGEGSAYRTRIFGGGYKVTIASYNGDTLLGGITVSGSALSPLVDNAFDIGSQLLKIKDAYIAGKIKDGTHEWNYNSIGFPVIPVPASTTLTADEILAIQKGCQIDGNFLNLIKPTFYPARTGIAGILSRGMYIGHAPSGNQQIGTYQINESTGVIGLSNTTQDSIDYNNVGKINDKAIPAYPSDTGTFVLKCIDGILTWVQE